MSGGAITDRPRRVNAAVCQYTQPRVQTRSGGTSALTRHRKAVTGLPRPRQPVSGGATGTWGRAMQVVATPEETDIKRVLGGQKKATIAGLDGTKNS